MSFTFKWPRFSDRFHEEARDMLHAALNKGNKPPIIADKIEVVELEMGTQPPELEIKDIGELTQDQFRGIFKLTYSGDAFIVLRTKVQANPLNHRKNEMSDLLGVGGSRGILAAHQPLVVPMLLRLSQFRLNSYVVLVLSKQKGCTLVFKTDPLQNVEVSSTFDSIAVIQSFIQREIEDQLREMFREDLPGIIHRLSQRWVAGRTKVEAPYLKAHNPPPPSSTATKGRPHSTRRGGSLASKAESVLTSDTLPTPGVGLHPGLHPRPTFGRPFSSPGRSISGMPLPSIIPPSISSQSSRPRKTGTKTPLSSDFPINPHSSLPDIENFDPTYGLRPEGIPTTSGFSGLGKLFEASRGLHELSQERNMLDPAIELPIDLDADSAYDVVEWADGLDANTDVYDRSGDDIDDDAFTNQVPQHDADIVEEMETIPAIGGGFITRPRVYHSQSSIKSPLIAEMASTSPRSSVPQGSRDSRKRVTRVESDNQSAPRVSRSRRVPRGMHRDRGMSIGIEGDTYNPYFGDAYKNQRGDVYGAAQEVDAEEEGMGTRTEDPWREASRPIPQSTRFKRRQSESSDHPRSISRSPLNNDLFQYGSPSKHHLRHSSDDADTDPLIGLAGDSRRSRTQDPRGIILRNQSVSQLSALSKSNQTLSPYTRSFSHFTVRSGPPKPLVSSTTPFTRPGNKGPQKARRKRIHRLGNARNGSGGLDISTENREGRYDEKGDVSLDRLSHSPPPPSEFSDDDVAHYFRTRRPSEIQSPGRREKKLFSPEVPVSLRERTTSHSSQRSRQRTALPS